MRQSNGLNTRLFPYPQHIKWGERSVPVPRKKVYSLSLKTGNGPNGKTDTDQPTNETANADQPKNGTYDLLTEAERLLKRRGCLLASGEQKDAVKVRIIARCDRETAYISELSMYSDEKYSLVCGGPGDGTKGIDAAITVSGKRGLRYALIRLLQLLENDTITECAIEDYPLFPIRGILEGFYGPPWSQEARLDMLRLLSDTFFNTFFYAPKDDPFHRARWRDLYEGEALENLKELAGSAGELDIDFWYTISPGLSIEYSNEDDFSALLRKMEQVRDFGVSRFGLLLDDIPGTLQHKKDREHFEDLPEAHIDLSNRLFKSLYERDPSVRLVLCPTLYWGKGTEYYIARVGVGLDPRIEIFWTGPEICSRELTLFDASVFTRTTNRPVLYWDNYPVNDVEMVNELHIGPYRNRDRHLYRASEGIIANGMEYPESSKIPFITIGTYLWDPERYDPESSWRYALEKVVGREEWKEFSVFADNVRYSCLSTSESPWLRKKLEQVEFEYGYGDRSRAFRVVEEIVAELKKPLALFRNGMTNQALHREIAPWTEKYEQGVTLFEKMKEYLQNPGSGTKQDLLEQFDSYYRNKAYVFANLLSQKAKELIEGIDV